MARSLYLFTKSISTKTTPFSLSALRFQSVLSSPNPNPEEESPDAHVRKLEDAIHHLIVRRSAPHWLPFIPGSSYWVPPSRSASAGIAHLVEKLGNPAMSTDPLTDDESLATTSARGWPSSHYYIQGPSPSTEVKITLVNMDEESFSSIPSKSEDMEESLSSNPSKPGNMDD